jgi:hypothetical protein
VGERIDDARPEAGPLRRSLPGPADAVVFHREDDLAVAAVVKEDADFAARARRIGVLESVGDELGHHHADRHRLVGRHLDRLGAQPHVRRVPGFLQGRLEIAQQAREILRYLDRAHAL